MKISNFQNGILFIKPNAMLLILPRHPTLITIPTSILLLASNVLDKLSIPVEILDLDRFQFSIIDSSL